MRATEFITEAETYQPPELEVGDKILKGKFKNSPAEIKGFKKDKHNQPVLKTNKGDVQLFKPRVAKLVDENNPVTERNNGTRWTGDEIYRQIGDEGIDEGVVDWAKKGAAAGAIALGALGAGGADAKPVKSVQKPVIVQPAKQQVKQPTQQVAPSAQVKNQAPEEYNVLSNNTNNEVTLQKAAKRAGMKGTELAQFLAQMKHESWDFERMKEKPQPGVKDYYAKRYDMKYSPKTAKILGNKHAGDGAKYHGRGFVQLTGRDNYRMASDALGIDLLNHPELASKPDVAAKIAVWYWQTRVKPGIQNFADTQAVTQKINPALRGVDSRHANFKDYMKII